METYNIKRYEHQPKPGDLFKAVDHDGSFSYLRCTDVTGTPFKCCENCAFSDNDIYGDAFCSRFGCNDLNREDGKDVIYIEFTRGRFFPEPKLWDGDHDFTDDEIEDFREDFIEELASCEFACAKCWEEKKE